MYSFWNKMISFECGVLITITIILIWIIFARYGMTFVDPKLTLGEINEINKILKPGHLIVTRHHDGDAGLFTRYNHIEFVKEVSDNPHDTKVLGFTRAGYLDRSLDDMLIQHNSVLIVECLNFDDVYIKKMIEYSLNFKDRPFDYILNKWRSNTIFCSEFIQRIDFENRLGGKVVWRPINITRKKDMITVYKSPHSNIIAKLFYY
jgi:hypothetical protein